MKQAMAALALAMSLFSGAAFSQDKPVFVFTAIPDQDETRLVERFTRVAEYLQSKLGVPVKYLPVKSYPAAVTAFTRSGAAGKFCRLVFQLFVRTCACSSRPLPSRR